MSLLSMDSIYKTYHTDAAQVDALCGVSLTVERGEWVSIVGHSGSGKSTLMNIMGCLDTPTKGEYRFDGKAVCAMNSRELSRLRASQIGFVFQRFHLLPELTALENAELALTYRGMNASLRRKLATESLIRVGLRDRMGHRPCELSGGQQQRVAIARAIAGRPPLILADEPTGNLDAASGDTVISLLSELHEEGHTVVLITHDNTVAAKAQRCLHMANGHITEGSEPS